MLLDLLEANRIEQQTSGAELVARLPGTRRILVVDDDLDYVESLALALASMGYEVRTAHDGPSALAIAEEFRPHALALDVSLPDMDGFDVARELRKQPWSEKVVLVALTGWSEDEIRDRARDAGFDHFAVKPVEVTRLSRLFEAPPGSGLRG